MFHQYADEPVNWSVQANEFVQRPSWNDRQHCEVMACLWCCLQTDLPFLPLGELRKKHRLPGDSLLPLSNQHREKTEIPKTGRTESYEHDPSHSNRDVCQCWLTQEHAVCDHDNNSLFSLLLNDLLQGGLWWIGHGLT